MLHVYTTKGQPMTRYDAMHCIDERPMWIKNSPLRRFCCDICWKMRAAKNLKIQVYYDMHRIFCAEWCEPIKYREKRAIWAREAYRAKKATARTSEVKS